jgi:oleate hydratase
MLQRRTDESALVYLVGGGIASLAAAAFLIRDGDIPGHNITILEESGKIGGSLDAAGAPKDGYIMRGGRMIESKYLCTYDLFSSIPGLDERRTVTQEICEWNKTMKTSSKSRLFRDGHRLNAPIFGLSERHILTIERLGLQPEGILGQSRISDHFDSSFFETDFWFMWCSTFAFNPGTARSNSSVTCCASLIWFQASTRSAGSCKQPTTSTTRWFDRFRNG